MYIVSFKKFITIHVCNNKLRRPSSFQDKIHSISLIKELYVLYYKLKKNITKYSSSINLPVQCQSIKIFL